MNLDELFEDNQHMAALLIEAADLNYLISEDTEHQDTETVITAALFCYIEHTKQLLKDK